MVQRVAVAGVVVLSSILAARVLGAAMYAELAFFVFFTKALLLGNLGSISGYLVRNYALESAVPAAEVDKFHVAYTQHLIALAVFCVALGIWVRPVYAYAALGFAILIPFFVLEPSARIQRRFYISLIPDSILSLTVVGGTVTYALMNHFGLAPWPVMWIVVGWMLTLSMCVAWYLWPSLRSLKLRPQQADWRFYKTILTLGMPRFLATCTFTLFLMLDRVFLEHFYDRSELGVYMLAFQLATGSGLLLAAQNMVSGIDIGEAIRKSEVSPALVRRLVKRSLALGGFGLFGVTVFSYLLEHYFLSGYAGLAHTTTVLSLGLIAFLAAGNLTDLAFYRASHRSLIIGLVLALAAGLVYNVLSVSVFQGTVISLATFSGVILVLYACYAFWYTQKLVKPRPRSTI